MKEPATPTYPRIVAARRAQYGRKESDFFWVVKIEYASGKVEEVPVSPGCSPEDRHLFHCHRHKYNYPPLAIESCFCGIYIREGLAVELEAVNHFVEQRNKVREIFGVADDALFKTRVYLEMGGTGEYKSIQDRIDERRKEAL